MVKAAAIAALVAALLLAVSPAAGGRSNDPPKRASRVSVPCYHYWNQSVVYKKRPDRCDFAPPGCPVAMCVDPFKSINWNRYGGRTATAKGRPWANGPGWVDPVKFKLSKVRDPRCGPPVYTKISYKYGASYRLAHCR